MMNSGRRILVLLIFLMTLEAGAQNSALYNVKLRSGLLIKCELVKLVPDSFVVIRQYGEISSIPSSEVESIVYAGTVTRTQAAVKVAVIKEKPKLLRRNLPDSAWTIGFQLGPNMSVNLSPSSDIYDVLPYPGSSFRLNAMKGISKKVEAGFSVGIDPCLDISYTDNIFVMGVLLGDLRFNLRKDRPKTPFLYAEGGYGFNLTARDVVKSGGLNMSMGFGSASRTKTQGIYSFMLGLKLQTIRQELFFFTWPDTRQDVYYHYALFGFEMKMEWKF